MSFIQVCDGCGDHLEEPEHDYVVHLGIDTTDDEEFLDLSRDLCLGCAFNSADVEIEDLVMEAEE